MNVRVIFGTRPEAIKLAPVVAELKSRDHRVEVVCTGQHYDLLDDVLDDLELKPDLVGKTMLRSLDFRGTMSLPFMYSVAMDELLRLLMRSHMTPDWTVVQGDTASAFVGALVAHLLQHRVAHVEAGLRTYNPKAPFPEETNRRMISVAASVHFAPTRDAARALELEGIDKNVFITGNTVIDAALRYAPTPSHSGHILVTCHRRENRDWLPRLAEAISLLEQNGEFVIVVTHPHPGYAGILQRELDYRGVQGVKMLPPQGYRDYLGLIRGAKAILTDSGGTVEEASAFKVPCIIWRTHTERMEAVETGRAFLVGHDIHKVLSAVQDKENRAFGLNPFGDGTSASKIVTKLEALR